MTEPSRQAGPHGAGAIDRATHLQILSLENATLLAHRSLIWSEAANRATMYLAVLSGVTVTLALAAQATQFGQAFLVFALLLLPIVLYMGFVTLGRLAELNNEDLHWVQRLHRLRRGMLELDAAVRPYLTATPHDDWLSVSDTFSMGADQGRRATAIHGFQTLPGMIGVVNSLVGAILVGVIAIELGASFTVVVIAGMVTFPVLVLAQLRTGLRSIWRVRDSWITLFPAAAEVSTTDNASRPPTGP